MTYPTSQQINNKAHNSVRTFQLAYATVVCPKRTIFGINNTDELASRLHSHFNANSSDISARFINYERIDQLHTDEFGGMRYLVMDFKLLTASNDLQGSIHQICNTVLADRELIRDLSHNGYDMVSVSFDRQTQYDCL